MEFRKARERDAAHIVRMVNALIAELGGKSLDTTAADKACSMLIERTDLGEIVVVEDDTGQIVGNCCLSYQTAIRTVGRYAIVQEMYISPEYRGQNVGALLLRMAVETAAEAGCEVIELGTPPDRDRQEKFYHREGFNSVGLRMRKLVAG